jgi:serine/threonine protein kinase
MSPKIPILTGRVICGQVKLLEVIGTGGAGIVYRGIKQDGSPCAVKCLRNSDRALHEVKLHHSVSDHPNIINIDEIFAIGDFMFIVMEHCPGGDLLTAIEDGMFQGQDDLIKSVFIQLLDALHWCHENKVSHRDIKPENVLCNTDCSQIRLADFGLSCKEAFSVEFLSGTPGYLSPGLYNIVSGSTESHLKQSA